MDLVVDYSPAFYDTLPTVEQAQGKLVEKERLLPALGQVIVKHGLEKEFGVALLHKQKRPSNGLVQVRTSASTWTLTSQFKTVSVSMAPVQWRLVPAQGGMSFAPVEFMERSCGPEDMTHPSLQDHVEFVREFRDLLIKENAEEVFGISSLGAIVQLQQQNKHDKADDLNVTNGNQRTNSTIVPLATHCDPGVEALWIFQNPGRTGPIVMKSAKTC